MADRRRWRTGCLAIDGCFVDNIAIITIVVVGKLVHANRHAIREENRSDVQHFITGIGQLPFGEILFVDQIGEHC